MTDLAILTFVHTILSLVAIGAGVLVLVALMDGRIVAPWTNVYLATSILTSATGFLFPYTGFLPSHAFGIISLIALAAAAYGLYSQKLAGAWRKIYGLSTVLTVYLLVFVLIVQAFLKISFLARFAPTQTEPPFAVAQLIALAAFGYLGWRLSRRSSVLA